MAKQTMLDFMLIVLQILSYVLSAASYDNKIPKGLSLKMIHRDAPNSPFYRPNLTQKERMREYFDMSINRTRPQVPRNKSQYLNPDEVVARPKINVQTGTYMVELGIGTFEGQTPESRTIYLSLDTGSDLIWTQCDGCQPDCFHQSYPYFPSYLSATYRPFHASNCPPGSQPDQYNGCRMESNYIEGSRVESVMATETFTFVSEGDRSQPFPGIIFGCAIEAHNFYYGGSPDNLVSGIMGMGYGFYSFMEQTEFAFDGNFSYCLQSFFLFDHRTPMYLRFGSDVPQDTSQMQTTQLLAHPFMASSAHYLDLLGISVDYEDLNIRPEVFGIRHDGTGGCIIDTGTSMSWIISEAYQAMVLAVRKFFRKHNREWKRMRRPEWGHDLCWALDNGGVPELPRISFDFRGGSLILSEEAAFFVGLTQDDRDMVCFPFKESNLHENSDMTIVGAYQQVNQRIIYDGTNSKVHFDRVDCSRVN